MAGCGNYALPISSRHALEVASDWRRTYRSCPGCSELLMVNPRIVARAKRNQYQDLAQPVDNAGYPELQCTRSMGDPPFHRY
jgi:hypothetical protein